MEKETRLTSIITLLPNNRMRLELSGNNVECPDDADRAFINSFFRRNDSSVLFPIRGKFDVTERAIKRVQRLGKDITRCGYGYAAALEAEIAHIVNDF